MTRTVALSTDLPVPADAAWQAMQQPATFLYVVRGLLGFPALRGRREPFQPGETCDGWLMLFHILPLHRHTITVVSVDRERRTLETEEHGGLLRRWHHTLAVKPVTAATSRYSDSIDIDAGPLTGLVYWSATVLFRYRQRRWRRLARRSDGPAMGRLARAAGRGRDLDSARRRHPARPTASRPDRPAPPGGTS